MNARLYSGVVKRGEGYATRLGFPTVNIASQDTSLSGIYAGLVHNDGHSYIAAIYKGDRPILEAHLLDYSGELYGKEIQIEIREKIRDDRRFSDEVLLAEAIARDIEAVRQFFNTR